MKVFRVESPRQARMLDIPQRPLAPDEALIRVVCAGICGTDLAIYSGECDLVRQGLIRYPVRIGHEWSGVVCETGSRVRAFSEGDRVIADNSVSCGGCDACRRGDYNQCRHTKAVGTINCWDGCFAEYIIMPERHLYHLPDAISDEQAAMIEPATISYAALAGRDIGGRTVAVIGTGPIGLSALPLARSLGARQTIMIGRTPSKLEIAGRMGATHLINSTKESAAERVRKITGGGADIVLEASGAVSSVGLAVELVREKGDIYLLAFYDKPIPELRIDALVYKAAAMRGVMGQFGLAGALRDRMGRTPIDFLPMVTGHVRFEELERVFENASGMKDRVKILVHF